MKLRKKQTHATYERECYAVMGVSEDSKLDYRIYVIPITKISRKISKLFINMEWLS